MSVQNTVRRNAYGNDIPSMNIRSAENSEIVNLSGYDKHIRKKELKSVIALCRAIASEISKQRT